VLISGRWEDSVRYTRNTTTQQYFDDVALTGRYGVVYQPVPERLSLYATYGESFTPLNTLTFNNEPFVPETGQLWEAGLKFDMTDDFSFTLAGFDVFRQNAAVADPINPGFSVQTGEVESKGFEALLMGYLTDNWTISANCAYIDARITQDTNTANIGLRPVSTPYYTESVWTRYNILQSEARTVGFGLGYLCVNNRLALSTPVGAFHLPDYDRWDLAFYYDLPRWQFALNIENVLDAEYYVGSQNATNVTPGAPITALGTIRYTY
jgi:iron complex outermembrane receptor protein